MIKDLLKLSNALASRKDASVGIMKIAAEMIKSLPGNYDNQVDYKQFADVFKIFSDVYPTASAEDVVEFLTSEISEELGDYIHDEFGELDWPMPVTEMTGLDAYLFLCDNAVTKNEEFEETAISDFDNGKEQFMAPSDSQKVEIASGLMQAYVASAVDRGIVENYPDDPMNYDDSDYNDVNIDDIEFDPDEEDFDYNDENL